MNECHLKKGTSFERKFHLPSYEFSGDMLVFRGVWKKLLAKDNGTEHKII